MTQQPSVRYVIAYGYNEKFYLTAEEAAAIVAATEQGKRVVKFSDRVFTTTYSWIMPVDDVKSEQNTIASDSEFQKYKSLKAIPSAELSEADFRLKVYLEGRLAKRYPYEKYATEWDEANKTSKSLAV